MKGHLNLFQRSMLRWREMHPYNAVHVIRIEAPLDAARMRAIIDAHLVWAGLTGLVVDAEAGRFEYKGGPSACELRIVPVDGDPLPVLTAEIERELNLQFATGNGAEPFRFFAADAGRSFHLGVAYDHFIAGGDSIVILLKGLWERYTGAAGGEAPPPALDRYPPTFSRLIVRHPWDALRSLRAFWELPLSCRRAFRPRYASASDLRNGFACVRLAPGEVATFEHTARAWGVTRNDLLVAALMQTLSPLTEARLGAQRRNELAIATVINLRADVAGSAAGTFGQFLSSFRVSHRVPPGIGLQQLAREVHAATARIRRTRRYFQALVGLQTSGLIWRLLAPERRVKFHGKSYPLWGGTTPLDVNALWKEAGGSEPIPEYLRGVSTGPVAPLVLALTSAGDAIHLGLSYRKTAFETEKADKILSELRLAIKASR